MSIHAIKVVISFKLTLFSLLYFVPYMMQHQQADETLSRELAISSQSKQKLRSKRRSKIVKIYAN